ncbi:redoxin domain-containing protein [Thalassotalea ganghwensis]
MVAFANAADNYLTVPISYPSGKVVKLADFKGKKPVYIKFWASWCVPCMKEMPHYQQAYEKLGDDIEFVSINLGINDGVEDINKVVEKFGLTMPVVIDNDGQLAQIFKFVGTPYHLLFDQQLNLVHRGHQANESLDNKMALVAGSEKVDNLSTAVFSESAPELTIANVDKVPTGLFFVATWCDWYLKDSRPKISQNCIDSQLAFNQLVKTYPKVNWVTVVSSLWTGEQDLKEYQKRFNTTNDGMIDQSNKTFVKYSVKDFPTLVLLDNGKEIYRTTTVDNDHQLIAELKAI